MTSSSKKGRGKAHCPSCGSRSASVIGSDGNGGMKAGCLECGHFFVVLPPEKRSGERKFGKNSMPEVRFARWTIGVVVIASVALGLGIRIGISQGKNDEIKGNAVSPAGAVVAEKPEISAMVEEEVVAANKALNTEDLAMRKALGLFLGASTWMERMKVVRHPEITGARMSSYYRDHEDKAFADLVVSTKITRSGSLVVFTLEGEALPSAKLVMEKRNGRYLVDWESFVLWQEFPWKDIPKLPAGKSCEIRCLTRPLPNNHPSYREDDGWMAFELVHPGTSEILYGYLKKREGLSGSQPAAVLQGGALGPVTLSVTPLPRGEGQVIISDVLALGWIHPVPAGNGKTTE